MWGNLYLRILRSQLEQFIAAELGTDHLINCKRKIELRKIKKEMSDLKKRLEELQTRKTELEKQMRK